MERPLLPPKRSHVISNHATLGSSICDSSPRCRQFEGAADEGLVGAEMLLQRQEDEVHRLQAHLASRLSRANLYNPDDPLSPAHTSVLDLGDPLYTSSAPLRKAKVNMISASESPQEWLLDTDLLVTIHHLKTVNDVSTILPLQSVIYCNSQ